VPKPLELLVEIARIAPIATIAAVGVAAWSIFSNTARARKELAVNLVNSWASQYSSQMKQALDLAAKLEDQVINDISTGNGDVTVNGSESVAAIQYILKDRDPFYSAEKNIDDLTEMTLTREQCRVVDYEWVSTLNNIEAICTAWDSGAAELEIMENLFVPLLQSRLCVLYKLTQSDNTSTMISKMLKSYNEVLERRLSLQCFQQRRRFRFRFKRRVAFLSAFIKDVGNGTRSISRRISSAARRS
jgi:hypothetical protein